MIPKVIHYCWFGGNPLPDLALKCIDSWKKYCPDYDIVRWDESNFDIGENTYAKEAYEAKKWAYVSDYARLKIIYENGGIYFDTDVEVIKPIDELLKHDCFLGTETDGFVATGLGFGAVQRNEIIGQMIQVYKNLHFLISRGVYDYSPCPERNTRPLIERGFQFSKSEVWNDGQTAIYPPEFFCPIDYMTGKIEVTERTYTIHHFAASWCSTEQDKEIKEATQYVDSHYVGIRRLIERQKRLYRIARKYEECDNYFQYFENRIRKKILYKIYGLK